MAQTYEERQSLAAWNALAESIAATPRIAVGMYTGDGTYGASNPKSLTFSFEPKLVLVYCPTNVPGNTAGMALLARGLEEALAINSNTTSSNSSCFHALTVAWSGNTVSWYRNDDKDMFNANGFLYYYCAIG